MTARNQPHQYRCRTCNNRECRFYVAPEWRIIGDPMYEGTQRGHWEITAEFGCASHSDASKAEQPCKYSETICHSPDECDYRDFAGMTDTNHPRCVKSANAEQRIKDVIAELERRKESLEVFTVGKEAGIIIGYEDALALLRGEEE